MKKRKISISRLIPLLSLCLCGFPLHATVSGIDKKAEHVAETFFPALEQAKNQVRGIVVDSKTQEPIIGATATIKGTSTGAATNIDGEFILNCKPGDIIVVNYLGYQVKEVKVSNLKLYTIELDESTEMLGEVVVTAFGVGQKKASMVGSVAQVRPEELKVPSSSLSSSFAGRLSGVIAVQRSGEPGADGADFWIRGKSTFSGATGALIILDGVEISATELNALDAEVIEGFSILKDATATALYGTRGANGVMIITTKSGKNLEKPIINFRLEGAVTQLSKVPEMADGVTYMRNYNEAVTRPGSGAEPFSEERIQATLKGLNPYVYPNVNWYDELFKKNAFSQRANFNIRGGSKKMDYFMSVGVKHSDGNLRSLSKDFFSYDNNINVTNYDFINNLNLQATSTTKLSLGLNLSIKDWKGPNMKTQDLFAMAMHSNPVDFPVMYPAGTGGIATDDILWGDKSGGPFDTGYGNPVAEYVTTYKTNFESIVTANFKIEQKLDMILKGLTFNGLFSFKNKTITNSYRGSAYNAFEVDSYDADADQYTLRRTAKEYSTVINTTGGHGGERNMYLQAMLDYKHIFADVHDVNVMFLFNRQQYNTNTPSDLFSTLPKRKQGIAGRVSYAYDNRYMAEVNFGYNGSENFAPNNRYGFFPSFAVGYNISEEDFWEKIRPVVSNLKLRASWGLVGNDDTSRSAGRFAYLEDLTLSGGPGYVTGIGQNIKFSGPKWKRYLNPDLGWEVGEKWNFGLDMGLFNAFNLSVDLFKETRSDIFLSRSNTIPAYLGLAGAAVYANLGKMENKGIDFSVDYNKQINKDFFLSFKGTFTYAHNTILERDEPPFREYPNLSSVGHSDGQYLLYVFNGLFPDEATIKNNPKQMLGFEPLPGDIWYKNLPNGEGKYDNVIDSNDRMYMGNPKDPEIVYGFGPSMKWKKWDCSFFFQGVAKTSILMSGIAPFGNYYHNGLFKYIADDHWSAENPNPNAKYPRLTLQANGNNEQASDYYLRNGAFLKLKNAEIGYTHKGWRFYVSGNNLLTFSPFDHWDPEMGSGNGLKYPTQRTFNVGVQVTFNNK
ncbi:SusC/RagA family TonB-linked outer membrane protein [Bacteroides fluxus]|uniref:SusC/RagA family TonB-linked outer membrane protein n=1 Tax=Bacteroides fluxus TaxID=626930 RepID=UPI002353421A|nr:TonB-dependent receptor [Bacteroides fluxus]